MKCGAIRGSTRLIGLIGDPVAHSISPQIHNYAFAQLGIDCAYVPLPTSGGDIHTAIAALRAFGFAGANVTIPHKRAVLPWCDTITDMSRLCESCNTLYFDNGLLRGATTDGEGFLRALRKIGRLAPNEHIVILGNGGSARALGFVLALQKEVSAITVVGRNEAKARALATEMRTRTGAAARIDATTFDAADSALWDRCTLLVNCTPVGMHPDTRRSPLPREALQSRMAVFDTVYNPAETLLLRYAREQGCTVQNGLSMLLYQGLASFACWTGVTPPEDIYSMEELQKLITG